MATTIAKTFALVKWGKIENFGKMGTVGEWRNEGVAMENYEAEG